MRQWGLGALLLAAMVFASAGSSLLAQGKKDAPTKAKGPIIELNESLKDGRFRFVIRDAEGKYLAGSLVNGYATEKDALKAIEDLKMALSKGTVVKQKKGEEEKKDKAAKDKKPAPVKDK
ncbi:MAG: hypothetical protein SNJ82_03775 [Gemmataceae bacterium]